jgi:hypothetical protein
VKPQPLIFGSLLALAVVGLAGCHNTIVRAAPPSVAAPPAPLPQPAPPVSAPPVVAEAPPTIETPPPSVEIPAVPGPARPRSAAPPESEASKPQPEPPQISPQLSATQLADAQRRTTDDIRVAERNLQLANRKELNAAQKDLADKVQGFLAQAHEAIRVTDWVRAQSLAQKAQVLSAELVKSL